MRAYVYQVWHAVADGVDRSSRAGTTVTFENTIANLIVGT